MTRFVFFDLDGTLVDHDLAASRANLALWRKFGDYLNLDIDSFSERFENAIAQCLAKSPGASLSGAGGRIMQKLFQSCRREISEEAGRTAFDDHMKAYLEHCSPYPDAAATLARLAESGLPLGIISNGDRPVQLEKMRRCKLINQFQTTLFSSDLGAAKPDPLIFNEACRSTGLSNKDCFFIGDDFEADMIGAQKSGLKTVWVDRKNQWNKLTDKQNAQLITFGRLDNLVGLWDIIEKMIAQHR